jgi:hypothetical protein
MNRNLELVLLIKIAIIFALEMVKRDLVQDLETFPFLCRLRSRGGKGRV